MKAFVMKEIGSEVDVFHPGDRVVVGAGVGMADKAIATGLCPGGRLRMERLLQILETGPTRRQPPP